MNRKKEIWAICIGLFSLLLLFSFIVLSIILKSYMYLVIALILSWIVGLIVTFHILNSTRISDVKLCWIFVCSSLPIVGIIIFLIFGINPLKCKNRKKYLERQILFDNFEQYQETHDFLKKVNNCSNVSQIIEYAYNVSHKPLYLNNNLKFIDPQSNFYSEAIKLIRSAKNNIYMQFYIYADSIFLKTIISELVKRAKDGVKVYIIYDWVGINKRVKKGIWKRIIRLSSNIQVSVFNPWTFTIFTSKTNFRSHRKCIIVDNKIAIYGGSNIADEYLSFRPHTTFWEDVNCVVEGPIVNSLSLLFILDWKYYCRQICKPKHPIDLLANLLPIYFLPAKQEKTKISNEFSNVKIQICESSPDYDEKVIRDLLLRVIGTAKKRIWVITPYFIVSEDIMNSLRAAALSGVDIQFILPGEPDDKKYILTMNRYSYPHLLGAGIKIYEYHGFCHSKLIIVDDELVLLGTFNFDFRSFYINFESTLILASSEINTYCAKYFLNSKNNSNQISLDSFNNRIWKRIRFRMSLINVYHPLM